MPAEDTPTPQRIAEHFATDPDRADVWKALDLFLDTDAYLNLGYSRWYQPHWLPSSQRRLVDVVGNRVNAVRGTGHGPPQRLLDLGSGRGGPAVRLAANLDCAVLGVDLVGANLRQARAHAQATSNSVGFTQGAASALPIASQAVDACTAIDSLVYMPDKRAVLAEAHRVLADDGVLVLTDLVESDSSNPVSVAAPDGSVADTEAVDAADPVGRFTHKWDMPGLITSTRLREHLEAAGFEVLEVTDISFHSIRQFRRYTRLYLWLASGFGRPLIRTLAWVLGLNESVVTAQIRAAHRALPFLDHVLVVAEPR